MVIDIRKKVFLITGASRGIGAMLAEKLLVEQANLVLSYNHSNNFTAAVLNGVRLGNVLLVKCDIRKKEEVEILFQRAKDFFGKIDVVINNAGIISDSPLVNMSASAWHDVIDTNLTGTAYCCQQAIKTMKQQQGGKIINIASFKGETGSKFQSNYSASKAGIIALTKSIAMEVGDYGICVNSICPGFILTDLNKHQPAKIKHAEEQSVLPIMELNNNLIHFVILLSSDFSNAISGRNFNLDSRIL